MEVERLRLVYANLPVILLVTVSSALILVLLLQTVVSRTELLVWLCVGAGITAMRYWHYRQFRRLPDEELDAKAWRTRLDIGTGSSGVFWVTPAWACFRRATSPYALLFVDLDHFKEINDTGGHAAGDETLRRVGRILKSQIRANDTAARMGGDEFAILLQGCPRQRAERVAASILAAIKDFALHWEGGKFFRVGASIGIGYTEAGEHDASAVLRAADSACYAAKKNGRGRIEVYHADPIYEASGRFQLSQLQDD